LDEQGSYGDIKGRHIFKGTVWYRRGQKEGEKSRDGSKTEKTRGIIKIH